MRPGFGEGLGGAGERLIGDRVDQPGHVAEVCVDRHRRGAALGGHLACM